MGAPPEPNTLIAVFAKAPIPGHSKTRLIPLLGAEGAAALQSQLIERTLRTVIAANVDAVELWCASGIDHPFLRACASRFGITLRAQCEGDIGQRMHHTVQECLQRATRIVLVGTDCPPLTPEDIHALLTSLDQGSQAAFLPVEDGGYTAIALCQASDALFTDIEWSSERVMPQTRARLRDLGWRWFELPQKWDLDRPADHERMRRECPLGDLINSTTTGPAR